MMGRISAVAAAMGMMLANGHVATAQTPAAIGQKAWAPAARGAPYTMPRSEVRTMTSKAGGAYRIFISWPEAPPPPRGYPLLVLLDGNASFAIASEVANKLGSYSALVPGVVVAIGYPDESRRFRDYTPDVPAGVELPPKSGPTGGVDAFLSFVGDELLPSIQSDFPVDPDRRTLMGYSLAGLFVLETMFRRPDLFRTYVASSPSIFYGNKHVLTLIPDFADKMRKAHVRRQLFLTAGQYEQSPAPGAENSPAWLDIAELSAKAKILDNARDLATQLTPFGGLGLDVDFRVVPGETHATGVLPAIRNGLAHAFSEKP